MKITLIGYMGSGKSTVGQKLALELGLDFYDLDMEIEKRSGYTITETIFNKGELYFRDLERKTLLDIMQKDNFVLSTGGGTPCYYDNIDVINKGSLTVYLEYGLNELNARLEGNKAERPLIAHLEGPGLKEYIGKHLFERRVYYEKATFTVKGDRKSSDEIVSEIRKIFE